MLNWIVDHITLYPIIGLLALACLVWLVWPIEDIESEPKDKPVPPYHDGPNRER